MRCKQIYQTIPVQVSPSPLADFKQKYGWMKYKPHQPRASTSASASAVASPPKSETLWSPSEKVWQSLGLGLSNIYLLNGLLDMAVLLDRPGQSVENSQQNTPPYPYVSLNSDFGDVRHLSPYHVSPNSQRKAGCAHCFFDGLVPLKETQQGVSGEIIPLCPRGWLVCCCRRAFVGGAEANSEALY